MRSCGTFLQFASLIATGAFSDIRPDGAYEDSHSEDPYAADQDHHTLLLQTSLQMAQRHDDQQIQSQGKVKLPGGQLSTSRDESQDLGGAKYVDITTPDYAREHGNSFGRVHLLEHNANGVTAKHKSTLSVPSSIVDQAISSHNSMELATSELLLSITSRTEHFLRQATLYISHAIDYAVVNAGRLIPSSRWAGLGIVTSAFLCFILCIDKRPYLMPECSFQIAGAPMNDCCPPTGYYTSYGVIARLCVLVAHVLVAATMLSESLVLSYFIILYPLVFFSVAGILSFVSHGEAAVRKRSSRIKPPQLKDAPRQHVVLVPHYKEERWLVDRTLQSIDDAASQAEWPVLIVHAIEEDSTLQEEHWNISGEQMPHVTQYVVAIHPRGLKGERPGLGSNLRYAVEHIIETLKLPPEGTMVTKLDANAILGHEFFPILEEAWKLGEYKSSIGFQTLIHETGHEEWDHLGLCCRLIACGTGPFSILPAYLFPGAMFHSTFCLPLELILYAGSWDPWLIQEDNLMAQRPMLALRGEFDVRLLPTSVFNAPALSVGDFCIKMKRSVTHGWYAAGFALANVGLLSGRPVIMILFVFRILSFMMLSILGLFSCLFTAYLILTSPGSVWKIFLITTLGNLCSALGPSRDGFAKGGIVLCMQCFVLTPCVLCFVGLVAYICSLKFFLFHRDCESHYETTNTLSREGNLEIDECRSDKDSASLHSVNAEGGANIAMSDILLPTSCSIAKALQIVLCNAKYIIVLAVFATLFCCTIVDKRSHGPSLPNVLQTSHGVCEHLQDVSCVGAVGTAHLIFGCGFTFASIFIPIAAGSAFYVLDEEGSLSKFSLWSAFLFSVLAAVSLVCVGWVSTVQHSLEHAIFVFCFSASVTLAQCIFSQVSLSSMPRTISQKCCFVSIVCIVINLFFGHADCFANLRSLASLFEWLAITSMMVNLLCWPTCKWQADSDP